MSNDLSHFDDSGNAHMVDVGAKDVTERVAVAKASVIMQPATLKLIRDRKAAKGDVLTVAQLAGIMAAKKTPDLIPLCHPLALSSVSVTLTLDAVRNAVDIEATCKLEGPHGCRDGSSNRGLRRRADRLRHVQGGRPRHGDFRGEAVAQVGRQVGDMECLTKGCSCSSRGR